MALPSALDPRRVFGRAAKPAMKKWFVSNIEDGQVWYDKLERAVKKAEAEIDSERRRTLK